MKQDFAPDLLKSTRKNKRKTSVSIFWRWGLPQQTHPPKGSMDPGYEPWCRQGAQAGRAPRGTMGSVVQSRESRRPTMKRDVRVLPRPATRPAAALSPAWTPERLASSEAPHLPPPRVQLPPWSRPAQPQVRFPLRTGGLGSRKTAQTHKAPWLMCRDWASAAVSSGKRSLQA